MHYYKALNKQTFQAGIYSLVPIRMEDRYDIMKWRNEQIYHLRQDKPLTKADQDSYFKIVIQKLFSQRKPPQILFSFLEENICVGYGGLVHIDWQNKNTELSFLLDTVKQIDKFDFYWKKFLPLLEEVAFNSLKFHKIYTYAFDLRPNLYNVLENAGYNRDAVLREHYLYDDSFIDVLIHSKINPL